MDEIIEEHTLFDCFDKGRADFDSRTGQSSNNF